MREEVGEVLGRHLDQSRGQIFRSPGKIGGKTIGLPFVAARAPGRKRPEWKKGYRGYKAKYNHFGWKRYALRQAQQPRQPWPGQKLEADPRPRQRHNLRPEQSFPDMSLFQCPIS